MTHDYRQLSLRRSGRALGVILAASTVLVAFAPEARAACFTTRVDGRVSDLRSAGALALVRASSAGAMVDNGVAPAFGNVCVGVWKRTGLRTYSLRHVTFNWDDNGRSTGTFQVLITVRLNRGGHAYAGTYAADSFDLAGNVIPELHAEGRLRGVRITVD